MLFRSNEAKLLDVGRPEAIGIQSGLDSCEPLCELDIETIPVGFLEHEQA